MVHGILYGIYGAVVIVSPPPLWCCGGGGGGAAAVVAWEHDFGRLEATMLGQLEARMKMMSGGSKLCSHREASTTLQDPPRRHCINQIAQGQEGRQ